MNATEQSKTSGGTSASITTLLAVKVGMDSRYDSRGRRVPVTVLTATPNVVVSTSQDKILLGLGTKKKVKKPQSIFVRRVGFAPRFIKEVKTEAEVKIGDRITVSIFEPGDKVKVTGITRGKGFTGVVKRWGFAGGPKTHGQSDRHRAPGSIGQTTTPGRVYKGKHMAGHQGNTTMTVTGLEVIEVDQTKNQLLVKGSVPGARNGFVKVQKTGRVKTYTPPPQEKEDQSETASKDKAEEIKGQDQKKEEKQQ